MTVEPIDSYPRHGENKKPPIRVGDILALRVSSLQHHSNFPETGENQALKHDA